MPHIYIAGPYSAYPIYGMRDALLAADRVIAEGIGHPVVPHLTGFWDFVSPKPYKEWLEIDLEAMRACDAVWRIPGKSSGADAEVVVAEVLGIPVFSNVADLRAFSLRWSR